MKKNSNSNIIKKIEVKCVRCGRKLFFLLPKGPAKRAPLIEIKCSKDRCQAINIVDYRDPTKLVVTLKKD